MESLEKKFKLQQFRAYYYYKIVAYLLFFPLGLCLWVKSEVGGLGLLILLTTFFAVEYVYSKKYTSDCIVETNANGFSIEVLTQSLKIGISKQHFTWDNLVCFDRVRTKNNEYLVLYLPNDDYMEFSESTSKAFYTYLKANFKEKERSHY